MTGPPPPPGSCLPGSCLASTEPDPAEARVDVRSSGLLPGEVALYLEAEPYLRVRHNDVHSILAADFALQIMEAEGGDRGIVIPAVLLHDTGWCEIPEERITTAYGPHSTDAELNRRHELEGARIAEEILVRLEYPTDRVREIVRIILTHDSDPGASTLEEAVVKDADKVWRVSPVGFCLHNQDMRSVPRQELYEFMALRAPRWFLTRRGLELARRHLDERREEYGFPPPPDIPPPAGDGIGDMAASEEDGS